MKLRGIGGAFGIVLAIAGILNLIGDIRLPFDLDTGAGLVMAVLGVALLICCTVPRTNMASK